MNKTQLTFDLSRRPALGRSDFLVSGSNAIALQQVENWQNWPQRKLALIGPEGAGKTHLAHVWAEMSGAAIVNAAALIHGDLPLDAPALVVEGIQEALVHKQANELEENLFHLHNALNASGGYFLVTGRVAPSYWGIKLPDLTSRLRAFQVATLAPPDDSLLTGLLVKLFDDRQLKVSPDLINYLVTRIDRSFAEAARIVDQLDKAALATARPVSRKLAADIIEF